MGWCRMLERYKPLDLIFEFVADENQGSSMGIEDAAVLAELLTHAGSTEEIPRLLRCYDQARHTRIDAVREYSNFVGKMFSYPDSKKQQMRDKVLRTYDPNQYPDSIPSITAHYGSAEWMTWLDVFDVKETVSIHSVPLH